MIDWVSNEPCRRIVYERKFKTDCKSVFNYVHVTTMNPQLRVASKEGLLEDSPSADDKYIPRHKDKSLTKSATLQTVVIFVHFELKKPANIGYKFFKEGKYREIVLPRSYWFKKAWMTLSSSSVALKISDELSVNSSPNKHVERN